MSEESIAAGFGHANLNDMDSQFGFIVKIIALSAVIALAIKYGGPILSVPMTPAIALCIVLLPSVVLAVLLGWRERQSRQQ